jgi:DNA-binding GntR family transcriptional regulator
VLDHVPRRGWRLRPFRQDDLQAFICVREVLELKAIELARSKLVVADLRRMLDANHLPTTTSDKPRIDESLHEYFITKAGNSYIRDFFERQGRYYRLLFVWEDHAPEVAIETIRQHREILSALLDKNWSVARRALSHHILENHPILGKWEGAGESAE